MKNEMPQFHFAILLVGLVAAPGDAATFQHLSGFSDNGFVLFGGHFPLQVSGDGTTIVGPGVVDAGNLFAVRWTKEGGTESLGQIPGVNRSRALAVSHDGSTIFGAAGNFDDSQRLFRWTRNRGIVEPCHLAQA